MKSPMKSVTPFALALALGIGLVACDQSKAELDSTKAQLATVTADRDNLKTQVTTLQGQLDQAKKDAADAQAKLAAMQAQQQAAAAAPAEEPKEKGKEHAAHHAAKAPAHDTSAPPGTAKNPVVAPSKGAGAF